ncbi:SusC/RagA family TonB-linked outer membrane protein [Zhouia sp. PK063]|uniref:SusC/RagA family TonB-linked outer membrane protein n=1 Tax=Zhouia sp. PK063 TaxID=3373602 RepID=UPI0037AF9120
MRTKLSGFLTLFLALTVQLIFAQAKTITGKVSDENNLPLPGASVAIKGTTTGTTTDFDGNFSIEAQVGQTLIFSYVGYAQQSVVVSNENTINLSLKPDNQLEEVVVTALGISREKKSLGYATQEVTGDEVSKAKETNFVNSLSGKVAGLDIKRSNQLGGSSNVIIRGYTSLTNNNQALFVIDGVPISNDISNNSTQTSGGGGYDYGNSAMDVNPEDIASVNVLKGAAATALYGSRAANGAIIITTKKGKKGKGLGVSINSGVTIGTYDKSTFPKYQHEYGAGYGPYYDSADGYFNLFDVDGDGTADLTTPFTEDASFGGAFDPNLMVYQWDAFYPESDTYMQKTPWVAAKNGPEAVLKTAVSLSNSISISAGSDTGSFRVGYTQLDQEGIVPNSKIQRNSIDFNGTQNITDKFSVGVKATYTNIQGRGRYGTGYDGNNIMQSFRQWHESNVDYEQQKEAYFRTKRNITWNYSSIDPSDPSYLKPIFFDNPYWTLYENYETDNRDRIFGNVNLNYEVTDWLTATARVSLDTYNDFREERTAVGSQAVSNYTRYNGYYQELNYDFLLTVNKNISDDLTFTGILGATKRTRKRQNITASTNGGLVVPRLYALSNSTELLTAPSEYADQLVADGYFTSLSFGYKNFLYLDLTGRVDRSSTLPKENNTYFYPSVSTGFVFSNLIKDASWLSFGKFRANYAQVGNYAPPLATTDTYASPTNFSVPLYSVGSTKNNPDLKNETSKSYEVGLEMEFFNRRLGFDMAGYQTNSIDQILPVRISDATGYAYKYVNAGEIRNRGIELSLHGSPIKTEDFEWRINGNFSKNKNLVLSLYEDKQNFQINSFQGGVTLNATVGQPYGSIWGTNFTYKNGEKVIDPDTGRYVVDDTAQPIGNINPDWKAGIQNTFTYKSLSLSFLIDMQQGGDFFSLDTWYGYATGIYDITAGNNELGNPKRDPVSQGGGILLQGVNPDGSANTTRTSMSTYANALGYGYAPNALHVYDASYVKLREVTLSYQIPSKLIDKTPFNNITVSAVGRNLWIIHKNAPYTDPEAGLSAGNLSQGYQSSPYPTTKEYGLNVKLDF